MELTGVATDVTVQEGNHPAILQTENNAESMTLEDLDSFNLIEPPPLDWRADSSSDTSSLQDVDDPESFSVDTPLEEFCDYGAHSTSFTPTEVEDLISQEIIMNQATIAEPLENDLVQLGEKSGEDGKEHDTDHSHIQKLLTQLQLFHPPPTLKELDDPKHVTDCHAFSCLEPEGKAHQNSSKGNMASGLLFTESHQRDLLLLLEDPESEEPQTILAAPSTESLNVHISEQTDCQIRYEPQTWQGDEIVSASYGLDTWHCNFQDEPTVAGYSERKIMEQWQKFKDLSFGELASHTADGCLNASMVLPCSTSMTRYVPPRALRSAHRNMLAVPATLKKSGEAAFSYYGPNLWNSLPNELRALDNLGSFKKKDAETEPSYKEVPGPCDPEDLLEGVIFGAKYLGSTQLQTDRNPSTNARMAQAQEAVDRIKAPEGESQPMTEVDLFISTQRIKVLSADTQEAMMDHPLQMISYIADIESLVVLMVRRKPAGHKAADSAGSISSQPKKCWMICHVFSSDDAQIIAQAIGQAFGVAYQQFLKVHGIKASELQTEGYCLGTQELYNGDLVHFSQSENIKEVCISKPVGEILGVAVVESGWGSILPTVVVANLLHGGAAERSGTLSIGDRIMSVNGASLVGLPITTCHNIIRDLKNHSQVKLSVVHCPPVTMAIIKRPDTKYQLGFSVEDGIICSLMRGGIAERGGIRVGHRIIEINGQSVVATPHEKVINILSNAVGEIHLKTMPVSTYRLLTGQEQPVYI